LPSGRYRTAPGGDLDALAEAARFLAGDLNLYYSLNPVSVGLDHSARNGDILARRNFLVDLDPVKPPEHKENPATEEEHRRVAAVAHEIIDDLGDRGWPLPVLVDSGNGYHLLWRTDLPNTPHVRALFKAALKGLEPYHGEGALVGFECFDARRIAKLPGSVARKGSASADRPFRPVRLLQAPKVMECVTAEQLAQLAGVCAEPGKDGPPPPKPPPDARWSRLKGKAGGSSGRAYALDALEGERQRILNARPNTAEGRNVCLNRAAYALGGFVPLGLLGLGEIEAALKGAAREAGLGDWEIDRTFLSGYTAGEAAPRAIPSLNGTPPAGAPPVGGTGAGPGGRVTIRASEIVPRKVEWLWPDRVPLRKLTTFAGIGGLGKTFVLLYMASCVSRGLAWCDGSPCPAGEVLFISGEDDPDDTLVPRLIELGADLDRVRFLRTEAADRFSLADLPLLERAAGECHGPLMLTVIDPPTAYLGRVDDHKNSELRGLLTPLKEWTKHAGCSLVFNTHVNKSTQKVEAMARVLGSVAWVNAVRAGHLFARDPDDPERVLFVPMKYNCGPRKQGLAYRIVAKGDLATIEWLGDVDTDADRAINQQGKPRKVVAREWLIERFGEKREWESGELFAAARAVGVSRDAIFEAKSGRDLPRARKTTNLKGDTTWVWWVPEDWPHLACGSPATGTSAVCHDCPECPPPAEEPLPE
jgi:putative DNA primase/helicase